MAILNGKEVTLFGINGGSPKIKQTTGDKTGEVMSQKAVTDTFDDLGFSYRSYNLVYGNLRNGVISPYSADVTRAVTSEHIPVKKGMKIEFDSTTGYKFGYAFFDTEKVYDGIDHGWLWTNKVTVTIEADGYIAMNFGRKDEKAMAEDEFKAIKAICKVGDNQFETKIRDEIDNVSKRFEEFGLYYSPYEIVHGSMANGNISVNKTAVTRAISPEHIPVKKGMRIEFSSSDTYRYGYACYDESKVYDGIDHGWQSNTVTIENDGYIAINFRRLDEGEITEADFERLKKTCRVIYNPIAEPNAKDDIMQSALIEYGRLHDASYVFVRIPKTTNGGNTVKPHLALTTSDGSLTGAKVSPLAFARRENTAFVINAGLFDMTNMIPVGQTIINGEAVVSAPMEDDNGVAISYGECYPLCIDANGDLSAPYYRTVTVEKMLEDGVKQSIVGWGKLVENFAVCTVDIAAEIVHPSDYIRQSIGQFENGDYFVCTVEQSRGSVTNEAGMTYTELAELLVTKGVKFAYSLDGGGSAATVIGKRQLNRIYEGTGGRAVPTVIYFA